MAGKACQKKFRNCEAAAEMAAYEIQMSAFHAVEEDPEVEITDERYDEAIDIDGDLAKALRKARERLVRLGDRIAEDQ